MTRLTSMTFNMDAGDAQIIARLLEEQGPAHSPMFRSLAHQFRSMATIANVLTVRVS